MKVIVGLGNIGKEYEKTRHNVGFMVIDKVAENLGVNFKLRGCDSDFVQFKNENGSFILAKPRTYMNESGRAVKSLMKKFEVDIHDVLVILDDIDLEVGRIRVKENGSAGTHNGLKSIIRETGSQNFCRVRVGIGRQNEHEDLANYVLSPMRMTDDQKLGLGRAEQAVMDYIQGKSLGDIMGKFNGEK